MINLRPSPKPSGTLRRSYQKLPISAFDDQHFKCDENKDVFFIYVHTHQSKEHPLYKLHKVTMEAIDMIGSDDPQYIWISVNSSRYIAREAGDTIGKSIKNILKVTANVSLFKCSGFQQIASLISDVDNGVL